jgi:hypothetical protein
MIISEKRLRKLIRNSILEQVVGYKAPPKTYDDPLGDDDHDRSPSSATASASSGADTGSSSDDVSSDGGGYVSVGDMGVDVSLDSGSKEEEQSSAMQVKKLTQQRQQALNKGDTTGAESAGEQLALAQKLRR